MYLLRRAHIRWKISKNPIKSYKVWKYHSVIVTVSLSETRPTCTFQKFRSSKSIKKESTFHSNYYINWCFPTVGRRPIKTEMPKGEMPMENASNCQKQKCLTLLHVVDTINWRSMLRMVILKEIVKSVLRKLKSCNGEITKLKARKAYRESLKHAMEKLQSYATIQ